MTGLEVFAAVCLLALLGVLGTARPSMRTASMPSRSSTREV
jgi:hypothetical protein